MNPVNCQAVEGSLCCSSSEVLACLVTDVDDLRFWDFTRANCNRSSELLRSKIKFKSHSAWAHHSLNLSKKLAEMPADSYTRSFQTISHQSSWTITWQDLTGWHPT